MKLRFFAFLIIPVIAASFPASAQTATVQTGTPIVLNGVNPDGSAIVPSGVGDPSLISLSGTIEEFIQFNAIDSALEMGDLGGPKATGKQKSFGNPANPHSGSGLVALNAGAGENGTVGVDFGCNTFVRVATTGRVLRNVGPDGATGTTATNADDWFLPTQYARSVFGPNVRRGGTASPGAPVPDTNAQRNADINIYGTALTKTSQSANYSRLDFGPAPSNGFTWACMVTRAGLNDYRGVYTGSLTVSYFKY